MGRYKRYSPQRMISMPLASGGSYNFYEPDSLLSEQMSPKKALGMEVALRETSWNYYRVLGFLPNPSEVLIKLGKNISEFKYLLEDSHINGCMSSRKAGTCSMQWTLDRGDAGKRQYEVINSILKAWPIYDIIAELLNGVFFGYQPAEVIWERVSGNWLPSELVPKDPDWFRFSDLNELRYLTKRNMVTGEPVPQYKFVLARRQPSYERPYGRPLGSSVYWPAKFRHAGLRYWTEFCEKFGQPWLKASYPLGTQQSRIQEMLSMIDNTIRDGVVAFPAEFNVEALKMNDASSATIFHDFIRQMNEEISIAILGQSLTTTTSQKGGGGAFALGKVHNSIRKDIIDEDVRIVENVFNTIIGWIYELNWKGAEKPTFKMLEAPMPTKDDAQMAVYLAQTGVHFKKAYFQNRYSLTDDEFEMGEPLSVMGKTADGGDGSGNEDTGGLTHDSGDSAENKSTYDSTKESVHNLQRR